MGDVPRRLVLTTISALLLNRKIFDYTQASECRVTTSYQTLQSGKALLNHVITEHAVQSDQTCRIKCYMNHDCVSYNIGPSSTPGMMVCQLNDADRYQYPQDYQDTPGYSYRGTENKCATDPCTSANQTCQSGFTAEGYRCLCPKGFTGQQCETDIDECSMNLHNCSVHAVCSNTRGSFGCECRVGYKGNGNLCTDIDECSSGLHKCSPNATCHNDPGSYHCVCHPGFQGGGRTCTDIDECSTGLHNCPANAKCNNTVGSFKCLCHPGYTRDGINCTDIDECSSGLHKCSPNATCHNDPGSYHCVCHPGFQGGGRTCTDIDECTTGLHNCPADETCNNTVGSFKCLCLPGYTRDGITCTENWIRAIYTTAEVCVGAKGNSFGVFAVPYAGQIIKFKLVHVSGGVAWGGGSAYEGKWGDLASKNFEIHITNTQNQRLAPPVSYPLAYSPGLRYNLPGQNYNDPQLIFPDFSPFLRVDKDQVFRVWFGEDLIDYNESNNSGQTCINVDIMYATYKNP